MLNTNTLIANLKSNVIMHEDENNGNLIAYNPYYGKYIISKDGIEEEYFTDEIELSELVKNFNS